MLMLMKMVHLSICGTALHHPLKSITCIPKLKFSEQLTEVSQQDLQDNQSILPQSSLHIRFESSANKQEIPSEQYRQGSPVKNGTSNLANYSGWAWHEESCARHADI